MCRRSSENSKGALRRAFQPSSSWGFLSEQSADSTPARRLPPRRREGSSLTGLPHLDGALRLSSSGSMLFDRAGRLSYAVGGKHRQDGLTHLPDALPSSSASIAAQFRSSIEHERSGGPCQRCRRAHAADEDVAFPREAVARVDRHAGGRDAEPGDERRLFLRASDARRCAGQEVAPEADTAIVLRPAG